MWVLARAATRVACVAWGLSLTLGTAASTEKYIATAARAPHVVFVVVDDLGYNDWGWTNAGQVHTPVVDSLVSAAGAIMLENYYVEVREQHPAYTHTHIAMPHSTRIG